MSSVLGILTSPAAATVQLLPLLADAALKGVVVFGVAACAVVLCRRRSAATRHAIWAGAVVAQLALPVMSALLPAWRVPIADRLRDQLEEPSFVMVAPVPEVFITPAPRVDVPRVRIGGAYGGTNARGARAGARPRPVMHAYGPSYVVRHARIGSSARDFVRTLRNRTPAWWLRAAALVWLIGAVGIFARFVAGTLAVSRLARRSERVEDGRWLSLAQRIAIRLGLSRPLTLLRSGRFGIPVTWGIVYPVVLLPDDADEWTEERRRYVLVHEMAHVKRVDAFTQLLAQVVLAAFWFDPFVWIAAHRMRVEREHACDDYVLREGTPARTYASDLLAMVRALGSRGHAAQPAFAALAMARPADLEERMHAILDPKQDRGPLSRATTLALSLAVLVLVVPLAAFTPFGRRAMPEFRATHAWSIAPSAPPVPALPPTEPVTIAPELYADVQAAMRDASAAIEAANAARPAIAAAMASAASAVSAASVATTPTVAVSSWSSDSRESCSSVSLRRTGTSTSVHSSSDDDNRSYQYISSSSGRCVQLALWGQVEFAADGRDVKRVSRDGRLYIRERRSDADRELEITPDEDERPRYAYRVDGELRRFDDDARGWLADLLPEILRESGLNAPERVARLRKEGGVAAVLEDIAKTQSTSAKRAEYEALLHGGRLSDSDAELVMRQATSDLSSSDSELAALLTQMGHTLRMSSSMVRAAATAMEHISSDEEKRAVLEQYTQEGDREMLLLTMRQARSISSDGEKAAFLRTAAPKYLANDDEELRSVFFGTAQSISSDEEKRGALAAALPYAKRSSVLLPLLDVAREISSDSEKAELLVAIAKQGLLSTAGPREAFMRATRSLSSDSEYRRVMEVVIGR